MSRAEDLRQRAARDNGAGQPRRALRALDRARRILDDHDEDPTADPGAVLTARVNLHLSAALSHFQIAGLARASEEMASARRLLRELPPEAAARSEARWHWMDANIQGRAGNVRMAAAALERAFADLGAFTEAELPRLYLLQGMVHAEAGRPTQAARHFLRSAARAEAQGDSDAVLVARHNAGYATYLSGDIPAGLAIMRSNRLDVGQVPHAVGLVDEALALREAGLVREARGCLQRAADTARGSSSQTRAEIDLEMAGLLRLEGHVREAQLAAGRAQRRYQRVGATAWADRSRILGLQLALDRGVATPRMVREATAIVVGAGDLGDTALEDRARTVCAEILASRGEWAAAAQRLERPTPTSTRSVQAKLHRTLVSARVRQGIGHATAARALLRRGAVVLAAAQRGSASLDLRSAGAIHGVRLAALDLELALPKGAARVLESLERWRSATDQLPPVRPPQDPVQAALIEQLRTLRDRMRGEASATGLARLQAQADRVERQIRERDWALIGSAEAGVQHDTVIDPRERLRKLDREALWLFPYAGRLMGVGVVKGVARLRELMPMGEATELSDRIRADLRVMATRQLGPLRGAVGASLNADVTRLEDRVLRPWEFTADGVVLMPCREMAGLPWALTPSLVGRPLTVARSLGSWARRTGQSRARPTVQVSVGPRLDRAHEEAVALAQIWGPDRVVIHAPASASGLVRAVTEADIVHVAAHGTHEPQSPLFSFIELDDGPVFAHEFQPHGIRAKHVVLSACDVGTATVRPGEESLGLAASMLSLGAASVVAAISPVPDDVACEVMKAHHHQLAAGRPTDEALALAVSENDDVGAAFHCMGSQWRFTLPAP